ncbi:MerR family transcriptional regulator [uncultured Massilia sp.]|uniref:MerR family transcriptional regulator n=1 Tax=uncultured Massilia sp. TaxID=169973 RepID=UPI0025DD89D2|nr:MerR family transcriptional regulator [uncultured Massilia sp.]
MLKIGELAAAAGLTVRALHHYDSIGLLRPSARSDAGYQLYDRDDVARLHRIQALRSFGLGLADIGLCLDSPDAAPLALVERQLAALERRMAEAARMRDGLLRLRATLERGEQPDLSSWLTTLQEMSVYEQYFSKEELEQLPLYRDEATKAHWRALVEEAGRLAGAGTAPDAPAAAGFARRWLDAFEQGSGNRGFAARINAMAAREPQAMEAQFGMSPALMGFVMAAIGELKYATWAGYLAPDVVARMRRHHATRGHEWTGLFERVRAAMQADPGACGQPARALAREWLDLFHDMVGDDPQVVQAFRHASATEPLLRMGTGIGEAMLAWLRKAMP